MPQVHVGGVHALPGALGLLGHGGGIASLQLAPGALGPEQADFLQGLHRQTVILIGAEGGGVGLDVGGNELRGFPEDKGQLPALHILREEPAEIRLVLLEVFLHLHQLVVERAFCHVLPGGGGEDGIV